MGAKIVGFTFRVALDFDKDCLAVASADTTIWPDLAADEEDDLYSAISDDLNLKGCFDDHCGGSRALLTVPERYVHSGLGSIKFPYTMLALSVEEEFFVTLDYFNSVEVFWEFSNREVSELDCADWTFLGYDAVDKGLYSGLKNFDDELVTYFNVTHYIYLNKCGLFSRSTDAAIFCKFLDSAIAEHEPFVAVGLWAKVFNNAMNGLNNNIEHLKLFLVDRLKEAIMECSHWPFEYASYFVARGEVILKSSDTHHPREPPWSIKVEPIQEREESGTKAMQLSIAVYGSNAYGKGELHFGAEAHFFADNRPPEMCDIREFVDGTPQPLT